MEHNILVSPGKINDVVTGGNHEGGQRVQKNERFVLLSKLNQSKYII